MQYKSKNHTKFLLQYHIIFVAKYRRGVFANEMVRNRTKAIMAEIARGYDFSIQTQEIDPNKPENNLLKFVAGMGLEPTRDYSQGILSPQCLPFHHPAINLISRNPY